MVVIGACFLNIPAMPSLVHMLALKRIGEAAGRNLCPCLPQVAINAVLWLRSHHDPYGKPYIYSRMQINSPYVWSCSLMVRPLIRVGAGDNFNPQIRVNRFVFLNFPILSLGDHLSLTDLPQSPFPTGYVTLSATTGHRRFGSHLPAAGDMAFVTSSFLELHSNHMPPRTIRD